MIFICASFVRESAKVYAQSISKLNPCQPTTAATKSLPGRQFDLPSPTSSPGRALGSPR